MSVKLDATLSVLFPPASMLADPTGQTGVIFSLAHSVTGKYLELPPEVTGRYWRLLTIGSHVQFAFVLKGSTAAPELVFGAVSEPGIGNAQRGVTLVDGVPENVICPASAIGLVWVSNAVPETGGFFEAHVSGTRLAVG